LFAKAGLAMLGDMATTDSALNPEVVARIRGLLAPTPTNESLWPTLAAALFAAVAALAFATAMIMAPPVVSEHVVQSAPK
jgi:hypothetical protein